MDQQVTTILTIVLVFGFIVLIFGVLIVAVIFGRKREQERTRELVKVASLLGWQFSEAAALNWIPNLGKFALFSQGHGKSITNAMYGETDCRCSGSSRYPRRTGNQKQRPSRSRLRHTLRS